MLTPSATVRFAVLALLTTLVAGCVAPEPASLDASPGGSTGGDGGDVDPAAVQGPPGTGGGRVRNSAPTVEAFTGSLANADNSGASVEVFTGRIQEPNTEADVQRIVIQRDGALSGNATHDVTVQEAIGAAEPTEFGADGFKVWSDQRGDGVLHFAYRFTFPVGTSPGQATFTPVVFDRLTLQAGDPGVLGPVDATTIDVFSEVTIAADPVDAAGNALVGASWGNWEAEAGASAVGSLNYIKLVNTGQDATASVVVDFSGDGFVGQEDANYSVPIDGNLAFAWFEDTSPAATAPNEGTYTFGGASADGSVTVTFSGLENVIYVAYRVVEMPDVLPIQTYGAAYTATEL